MTAPNGQEPETDGKVRWCQPCRQTGVVHCQHVDFDCMGPAGPMLRIPREEAAARHAALRSTRS